MSNSANRHKRYLRAIELAVSHTITAGVDDVFRPPMFSQCPEVEVLRNASGNFRAHLTGECLSFLNRKACTIDIIGRPRTFLYAKDKYTFRRIAWIDLLDLLKYLSLVNLFSEKIEANRQPISANRVHSYRLHSNQGSLFNQAYGYNSFRAASRDLTQRYAGGYKVLTDIANFYDRINLHSLTNILSQIGCEKDETDHLTRLLSEWRAKNSFGVPVGSDASRILAEASLINVDNRLSEAGICFIRYVDDFRIFCQNQTEAYHALVRLTEFLYDEGLFLNGAKTKVYKILSVDADYLDEPNVVDVPVEHQPIDVKEVIEEKRFTRTLSGHSRISKFYRKPGEEALRELRKLDIAAHMRDIEAQSGALQEVGIRTAVKHFLYVCHDMSVIQRLVELKITSIYYIADALCKDGTQLSVHERSVVLDVLRRSLRFPDCPYVYQLPFLRVCASPLFVAQERINEYFERLPGDVNSIARREAIIICGDLLGRTRLRRWCGEEFYSFPIEVQRALALVLRDAKCMRDDEKEPLLKVVRSATQDKIVHQLLES